MDNRYTEQMSYSEAMEESYEHAAYSAVGDAIDNYGLSYVLASLMVYVDNPEQEVLLQRCKSMVDWASM